MNSTSLDWFNCYCAARKGQLSIRSVQVYGAWWHRYSEFLATRNVALSDARPSDAEAFLLSYGGNTSIRYFRLLKSVYEFAERQGLCRGNPLSILAPNFEHEEERVSVPVPKAESLSALYALATAKTWKGERDRVLVLLAAETGLRRHELMQLAESSLLLESFPPRISLSTAGTKRSVQLGSEIQIALTQWLERLRQLLPDRTAKDLVFPANLDGRALDPSTIYRIVNRHLEKVGVGKSTLGTSGARVLRAAFAHRNQEEGADLTDIQRQLGHRRLLSTTDFLGRIDIAK